MTYPDLRFPTIARIYPGVLLAAAHEIALGQAGIDMPFDTYNLNVKMQVEKSSTVMTKAAIKAAMMVQTSTQSSCKITDANILIV